MRSRELRDSVFYRANHRDARAPNEVTSTVTGRQPHVLQERRLRAGLQKERHDHHLHRNLAGTSARIRFH